MLLKMVRLVMEDRGHVLPSSVNHHQRSDDFTVPEEVPLWYPPESTLPVMSIYQESFCGILLKKGKLSQQTLLAMSIHRVSLWYPPEERKPLPGNITSDGHLNTLVRIQEMQMKCMQNLATQQHQSAMELTLPKPEVPVFSGDPISIVIL